MQLQIVRALGRQLSKRLIGQEAVIIADYSMNITRRHTHGRVLEVARLANELHFDLVAHFVLARVLDHTRRFQVALVDRLVADGALTPRLVA